MKLNWIDWHIFESRPGKVIELIQASIVTLDEIKWRLNFAPKSSFLWKSCWHAFLVFSTCDMKLCANVEKQNVIFSAYDCIYVFAFHFYQRIVIYLRIVIPNRGWQPTRFKEDLTAFLCKLQSNIVWARVWVIVDLLDSSDEKRRKIMKVWQMV